jgi:hypothetical protein
MFPPMEGHMFGKSIRSSTAEPSFFYLMMAATCFRRAASSRHPNVGGALRHIGRKYLVKAGRVIPTHKGSPSALRR